jgi:hypothetical protein
MPGKKNTGPTDPQTLKRIGVASIKRVWNDITPDQWLGYVKNAAGAQNWVRKGPRIMGLCPFHDEKSPSFTIDFEKHYAKCFGCKAFFWNPITFVAALKTKAGKATTYVDAMIDLKDTYGLKDFPAKVINGLSVQWRRRTMKRLLHLVSNAELSAVAKLYDRVGYDAASSDPRYGYAARTVRYLDYRGIPRSAPNWYSELPLGMLLPSMELEQLLKDRAEKENLDKDQMWELAKDYLESFFTNPSLWQGAVLYFTGDTPDLPSHVKIRAVPTLLPNGIFSTEDAKLVQWVKDETEDRRGMFGLYGCPPYGRMIDAQTQKSCVVVEGEFDMLSIATRQFDTVPPNIGFVCFSGGGGAIDGLDYLKEFGFEIAYIVGDNDPGGNEFVKSVLEKTFHLGLRIFTWPAAFTIPGQDKIDPDDAMKAFGLNTVQTALRDPSNYQLPYKWAAERALSEMVGIDPLDVSQLTNRASKWGIYVRDTAEQQAYVEDIQRVHHTVNVGMILSKMASTDEHEEAFIERIRGVLAARLSVLDWLREGNNSMLRVYDRITDTLYDLPLNEPKRLAAQVAALSRGKDIYLFIRNEVGEPAFIMSYAESVAKGEVFYADRVRILEPYVQWAVQRLANALPGTSQVKTISAGTHVIDTTDEDDKTTTTLYAVKGMSLFKGTYEGDCDIPLWRKCNGPADGNVVIYAEHGRRPLDAYPLYKDEDDFNRVPRLSFRELYDLVYRILSTGWRFKHHENTAHFMAAFILQGFIADAFARQPLLMITAEHSSGKTFLVGGLIGRTSKPAINIVQPALWMDNYTVAGVRQAMNNSTITLCLDEFEDKGLAHDPKSQTVQRLSQHFRGLANEAGRTIQGSVNGQPVEYSVHHPVWLAGIRQTQLPEDLSRTIMIEMDRQENRPTPEVLLLEAFGALTIRKLREDAPLIMWRELRALRRIYNDVAEQYKYGAGVEFSDISRSREHYYGALAIMKHAGVEYDVLFRDHFRLNRTYLSRIARSSLSGDILTTVLSVPAVRMPDMGDTVQRTVGSILNSPTPENLNRTASGCYYDKELEAIVIDFALARFTILSSVQEYSHRPADWLKAHSVRNHYYISDETLRQSGALDRLLPYMTRGSRMENVAAFKVTEYLDDAAQSRTPGKLKGMEDIDMSQEYAEQLKTAVFSKPEDVLGKKEAAGTGTSTGDGASDTSTPPPKKGVKDDDFNY